MKMTQKGLQNHVKKEEIEAILQSAKQTMNNVKRECEVLKVSQNMQVVSLSGLLTMYQDFVSGIPRLVKKVEQTALSKEEYIKHVSHALHRIDNQYRDCKKSINTMFQMITKVQSSLQHNIDTLKGCLESHRNSMSQGERNYAMEGKILLQEMKETKARVEDIRNWIHARFQMIQNLQPHRFKNEWLNIHPLDTSNQSLHIPLVYAKSLQVLMHCNYSIVPININEKMKLFAVQMEKMMTAQKINPGSCVENLQDLKQNRKILMQTLEKNLHKIRRALKLVSNELRYLQSIQEAVSPYSVEKLKMKFTGIHESIQQKYSDILSNIREIHEARFIGNPPKELPIKKHKLMHPHLQSKMNMRYSL